jgi:pimeloyl-ACP methyl ester carboxylesterase
VETLQVRTSFGNSPVLAAGDPSHPPLILIHGSNACAPIALSTHPRLQERFRVYAVDVLAQPNKSQGERMSMKDLSYGKWMNEVIDALPIDGKVTLVGFSLGALIALKTLEYDETPIREAFLSGPSYIANGNPFRALLKVFIPMRRFFRTKDRKYVQQFLDELFTERDEFAVNFLSEVFEHFEMDFSQVPTIRKSAAQKITTPITIFACGQDILFPGRKVIRRAGRIFPSLKIAYLQTESKHVQGKADRERAEEIILQSI